MPEALHRALKKEARKKKLTGKDFERYVYGGLTNFEKRRRKNTSSKRSEVAKP